MNAGYTPILFLAGTQARPRPPKHPTGMKAGYTQVCLGKGRKRPVGIGE